MTKKSINVNIYDKLTPSERKKEEDIRDVADAIEDIEKKQDGYQYLGEYNPRNPIVTNPHLNHTAKDFRAKRAKGEKIIPLNYLPDGKGDFVWLLNDADADAVQQGYACENCLEFQAAPNLPQCKWQNGGTCGHVNYIT